MTAKAAMPVRFMNLVEPLGASSTSTPAVLPASPTARRTTDTPARHTSAARSGAVTPLIGAPERLRQGDIDSSTLRSTRATTPGARTSSTATATPTTRTTSSALAPSADSCTTRGIRPTIHVVSVSSGKDSLATLLIALERCPASTIRAIFCDTGNEHEDVYTYLDYLEATLGIQITRLKADFTQQLAAKRMFIARDTRTRREYRRVPKTDKAGNPVWIKDRNGRVKMFPLDGGTDDNLEDGTTPQFGPLQAWGWDGGRKVRWTNKAKRRALAVMYPSGNPFLDLCMWKGRFPSRKAQFCTEELKRNMAVEYQLELMEAGHRVISWQGVRRDESDARRNAKLYERVGGGLWIFRPIVAWTAQQVFDFARARGIKPNPLYLQNMGRVGCMPCINCRKEELREIAARWPHHLERIADWEWIVGMCCKRGFSTFFTDSHTARDRREVFADLNVWARVEWSKTSRGGKQFNLLDELEYDGTGGCSSSYGLCDQGTFA